VIAGYNRKELLLAILCAFGSVGAYAVGYLFFEFAFSFAVREYGSPNLASHAREVSAAILVLISISGYGTWRSRGGFFSYFDSGLYHNLHQANAGGTVLDFYAHRVTGPAYLLSQVFLGAPLLALQSLIHLRNRVSGDGQLEERLRAALEKVQQANKWQSLAAYLDSEKEILLLAKMGKIDFSPSKGTVRSKNLAAGD
jgi:hypothetical protein